MANRKRLTPVEKAVYEILENRDAVYAEIKKALLRGSLVVVRAERKGSFKAFSRVRILHGHECRVGWDFSKEFVRSCFEGSTVSQTVSAMREYDLMGGVIVDIVGFEEISDCGKSKVFWAK